MSPHNPPQNSNNAHHYLPMGSTIGIIGGGQLGRMMAISAGQMGYHTHIYAPEQDSIAAISADYFTCAPYDDEQALVHFASQCDVITIEFENIPVAPLRALEKNKNIYPPLSLLQIAQHRLSEKEYAIAMGGITAPYAALNNMADCTPAAQQTGFPAIVKTVRMGYDGKGQFRVANMDELHAAMASLNGEPAILEGLVEFSAEFSVIMARNVHGEIIFYNSPHNIHKNGILSTSSLPAPSIIKDQQPVARKLMQKIAEQSNYVGILTGEFFASSEGPIFNEMAPRVHNSGHWTIEGAVSSQFENHIRAICGLPLGSTKICGDDIIMTNIIGDDIDEFKAILDDPLAKLHLYGKAEARPGRKMGHITKISYEK
ncbi:5-(carboxyamino)imidazole ribonucleotide synthase [Sphingorhabdus lutea]|uniref:N5-carboxyaminoimidazole ribonucleotide synthase n=1 Tax=Sphingorhabdus lutea TaxID=1913578 RepID=A0A1L3J9J2_9SPHN|nr:5-(carboxyamino)imidazole ribonucleotide synthase [Sphingorhabdus lutea]APG61797.1 5-(carboxyamino)imidazole ribonucleotide synthase [Sphingorhabdus lutea]